MLSGDLFKYHIPTLTPTSMSFTPLRSTKIVTNSVQTTQETTQKTTTGIGVKASVLFVKNYPNEDIVVLLNDSPTVITLRDVAINKEDTSNKAGIQDICKGVELMVTDFGVWDMYTAVMKRGSVIVCDGKGCDLGSDVDVVAEKTPEVILPGRRKRVSMI